MISAPLPATISGVIESIDGTRWEIGDHNFIVTSETQFFGERPQEGLVAKATLRVNDAGEFVATAVSVAGRPDSNPTTRPADVKPTQPGDSSGQGGNEGLMRILGKVQKIDQSADGQMIVVIDGVKILILASTVVVGDPIEGVTALAVVRRNASGSVTAVTIAFGRSPSSTVAEPADDDASTESGNSGPGSTSDDEGPGYKVVTIVVEQVNGRVILAADDIYLLTAEQARGLEKGDEITVKVRRVRIEDISTQLSMIDRTVLTTNPLYKEHGGSGSSKLYVAG